MKKAIVFLILLSIVEYSFGQKKLKSIFGLEMGLPITMLSPSTKSNNPLIQGTDPVNGGIGISGGIFAEFISARKSKDGNYGPGGGFKIRGLFNHFEADNNQFLNGETFKFDYLCGSLVYKICIGSNQVDIPSSKDDDEINIKQRDPRTWDVTYKEGKTHAGYRTTRSFFIYAGPQAGYLQTYAYASDNAAYKVGFDNKKGNIKNIDFAVVGGLEAWLGRIYLDISYQKGVQSIYNGTNVFLNSFIGRIGIAF